MYTVSVNSNDHDFQNVSYHVNKLANAKKQDLDDHVYYLGDIEVSIKYNKSIIKVKKYKNTTIVGTEYQPKYINFIELSSANIETIKKFITDSHDVYDNDHYVKKDSISIWTPQGQSPGLYWNFYTTLVKRDTNTVILDENIKDELYNDVNKFIKNESVYNKYGIPYKRVYCLYGPPGTGKSSIIFSLASSLNKNINILNFGSGVTDGAFIALMSGMRENTILLLEDIDALFTNRQAESSTDKGFLSFSTILNFLDGSLRKNGMIIVMTTNHPEKLDPALLRKGRVDYMLEIGYITKYQIERFAKLYYPNITKKQLESFTNILISTKKLTSSILSSFLFINRDKKIEEILKLLQKNAPFSR
jgi:chaperone BCS1